MSALDKIRQAFPDLKNASDSELLGEVSRLTGTPYESVATSLGVAPRGTMAETARQVGAGFAVDLPKMVGQGLQYTGIAPEAGRSLVAGAEERAPGWTPDLRGRGLIGEAVVTGARAVGPMAPAIAASFVPGGQWVAPAVAGGLFGTSSAQETYEKLISQGVSEADATAAARRVGLVQGPLEGVATAVGLGAFRAAKPLVGLGGTTAGVATRMTDAAVLKPFAKGMATNLVVQPGTEVLQDVGAAKIEESYGGKPEDIGAIARQSALGGLGLTMLLGPLAIGGHVARANRADKLKEALYSPDTAPEIRAQALDLVMGEAKRQGVPEANVDQWFEQQLTMEDARNEELAALEETQRAGEQDLLVTEAEPLQQRIDQKLGLTRKEDRKGYEKQFEAAFTEGTGQRVADAVTGVEREVTAGELVQRDLPQDLTITAAESKPKSLGVFNELDTALLADGITPTKKSRDLYQTMLNAQIDPASPEAESVLNSLAQNKPNEARKSLAEIIRSRSSRVSTPISTVQQPAGGVGVGASVVQGGLGDAGRVAPVAGTVVGSAPAAGATLQQASVLPSTAGQPVAAVAQPLAPGQFRRAPKPMTVLQAARAVPTPPVAPVVAEPAAPEVDQRQAVLQQIFGQRNGDIIFDVVGMGMPEPEAAAKYGLSRQAIQKIAGATGAKQRAAQIQRAKAEKGITDEQIAAAFQVAPQEELGSEVERDIFGAGRPTEALTETEAIEGGLENIVKTAGAGTSEVEGFTKLQREIDATLEALVTETDPAVLAELNAALAAQVEKVKAVEKKAQGEVRRTAGKVTEPTVEGEADAVQVESPTGVSVQPKAEAGKGVGGQVRGTKKPAAESKAQAPAKVLSEAEQAAQAWDVVAADFPQAPKFADLTKAQQQDFIEFGPENWERGDVELELTKMARAAAPTQTAGVERTVARKEEELPSVRFSKQLKKAATKNTVERIRTTMASAFKATFGNYSHEDFVRVHQTAEQAFLASGKKVPLAQLSNAQAFVDPVDQRVVHLIADNIPVGHEFAVLLHDVGVHVGLRGQLGALFKVLEAQVKSWSASPKNSTEFQVYEAAMARVAAGRLDGSIDLNDVNEELVAYAAEEAVARGVKPQASSNKKLERWLAQLKNVVEKALKNFFKIDTVPNVSAQDLVNFSYAAASKQMQEYRREPGAAWRDNPTQVIRFYANRGSLPDNARLEKLDSPGEEFFYWGKSSTYAGFTDIGTAAELRIVKTDGSVPDVRVFSMVVTSTESRKLGTQTGLSEDKVLQSFEAVEDPKTKVWSLSVYGPMKSSALYYELWYEDKVSTTEDVDGDEWTRLEGVGMRDNLRVLSEFRRRLTRAIGQVPHVDWTRVTGSGTNMEGGEGRYNAVDPETLATRYSKVAPRRTQGLIDRNIAKLPQQSQQPVRRVTEAIGDLGGKYLDYAVFTNDLVKRAQALGLGAAKTFSDRLAARNAKVSEEERKIEKIADGYALIEDANKGDGPGSVNEFLFESTRTGKWGYGKYRDAAMGAAFDKLGPKAQQFVKDVFAHGDATLSNKKRIVLNATNSEYDAMIKAAQVAGDTQAEAKLKAEKVATLKRFQTLFRIREGIPYAPIKRTGAYVVIGESAAYKAAKANKDTATIKKLESDPDHYHVSFVDTKWQARNLSDKLAEQGVFDGPQIVKRSESFDEAFSGEAMLPALTKMRAAVDRRAQDANGKKDPTAGKLLNIINQLYLEALAEGSARKSEMRRRGVAGEVDMLQSFTQQGRADANFLASVEYEPKIQDALQQMRNQSRTGDRERKSEIFDELTQRYADSMEPKSSTFINGLTNMASKFFLASSPGYYLQNLTQPFMMSLPAMAGRHDYTKAAAELAKAYTELGPMFKDVKLFDQQFDFSKAGKTDAEKAAINELVNQGKIDIGLATEINEYKVDADGKLSQFAQRLNKGMRMAVQKVEATNRLSTAIAAYRLEFAKTKDAAKATQYAADILTDTHGDYTAFNAPRAFNTQWGKVALQFRKFQLIQIAFYAKLIRDAFTKPDERAAALRTLAYSLSHSAVFAGMMGLPGYAAISAILGAFGDDDEKFDLTAEMRKALGPEWADMVMRGAPTVVGMDLSGKIGAGNMLSIMPFSDADLNTNAGRAEAFGTLMGGAALGMTSRVIDGLGLIASGDYYKGIERTMPKGVSDALKAGRQGAEGMTRRNGDVVLPDSEVSALDTVWTAMGLPAVKQAVTYERQNRMRDVTENFNDRTTRVKNDYAKAVREQDTQAMAEARAAWTKLQQTRQRNGLQPQPVSALLKAPQEQKAREKRTVEGVAYREGQRKLAESIAAN